MAMKGQARNLEMEEKFFMQEKLFYGRKYFYGRKAFKGGNMGVLTNLEPKKVFCFFEEITKIPHGSGNVGQISDYLVNFAKERDIFCIQDELKNIIMIKEASEG